jgi:hypothetical protein
VLFRGLRSGVGHWMVAFLLTAVIIGTVSSPMAGHRVIEEMEQYVDGKRSTIRGRPTWKPGTKIHVYIPVDPQGKGAEKEVEAACRAWEAKLRAETNADLSFEYHVGQQAPEVETPPPYVIEVHWGDESATDEPGSAAPTTNIAPTDKPNEYKRTSEVLRGDITINRNRSGGDPYALNAIYNIALHEFGHLFGLDHKTADQDSVIMADRGIDEPDKKLPLKEDDIRGLQDLYGRKPSSSVPPEAPRKDEEPSGTMCCATECGGTLGCVMVNSKAECDAYGGVLQPGTCEKTSDKEQDQGIYGRCTGGKSGQKACCESDLGSSHCVAPSGACQPGAEAAFTLVVTNTGTGPTWFRVGFAGSPWLGTPTIEVDTDFGPGSDPFDAPPAVTRCIPPDGTVTLTYRASIDPASPIGETVSAWFDLTDLLRRESTAFAASVALGTPTTIGYRWTFTVTPTGLTAVSIPIPDSIASALRALGVVRLALIDGGLPPMLALNEESWAIAGLVSGSEFLMPILVSPPSSAVYACLDAAGSARATLLVEGTVARPTKAPGILLKVPMKTDSDGDTVPDPSDACPDVPGDPAFDGCPGHETFEDTDGDGIPDNEDGCPNQPGPLETGGCPP